ncbi:MAG: hypothetical protein IT452_04815 [Planctomycetia bacterium]|nr:hypothetical protein [Planctomycetia bacterium]
MRVTTTHRSDFLRDVKAEFPLLRDAVNGWGGLLHLEMCEFARLAQAAIDAGDRATLTRTFRNAERHFVTGRPALRNAIAVSFVEHLNFTDGKVRRGWAWEALPAALQVVYRVLEAQAAATGESPRPAKKAKSR